MIEKRFGILWQWFCPVQKPHLQYQGQLTYDVILSAQVSQVGHQELLLEAVELLSALVRIALSLLGIVCIVCIVLVSF